MDRPRRQTQLRRKNKKILLDEDQCSICLTSAAEVVERGRLPTCDHFYCYTCIFEWSKNTCTCPNCKSMFRVIIRENRNNGDSTKTFVKAWRTQLDCDDDDDAAGHPADQTGDSFGESQADSYDNAFIDDTGLDGAGAATTLPAGLLSPVLQRLHAGTRVLLPNPADAAGAGAGASAGAAAGAGYNDYGGYADSERMGIGHTLNNDDDDEDDEDDEPNTYDNAFIDDSEDGDEGEDRGVGESPLLQTRRLRGRSNRNSATIDSTSKGSSSSSSSSSSSRSKESRKSKKISMASTFFADEASEEYPEAGDGNNSSTNGSAFDDIDDVDDVESGGSSAVGAVEDDVSDDGDSDGDGDGNNSRRKGNSNRKNINSRNSNDNINDNTNDNSR